MRVELSEVASFNEAVTNARASNALPIAVMHYWTNY
jgi:hypothetical protein